MAFVLGDLLDLYERQGFSIQVGVNPFPYNNFRHEQCAFLFKDGRRIATAGGIAISEIHMLEGLASVFAPTRIFVIGNLFGWSTLTLSLLFPKSKVIAIDNLSDGYQAREGLALTNAIIDANKLNCKVVIGESPQDVDRFVNAELGGHIDLAFIDGGHTNEQQSKDYMAIEPFVSDPGVILFHDVLGLRMIDSFEKIAGDWARICSYESYDDGNGHLLLVVFKIDGRQNCSCFERRPTVTVELTQPEEPSNGTLAYILVRPPDRLSVGLITLRIFRHAFFFVSS